jgi:uncharacterized cupredoxin-like copper-binding protein
MCPGDISLREQRVEKQPHRRRGRLAAAVFLVLLSACTETAPRGTPLDVTLRDFSMTPAEQTVPAGDVVINVHNDAPITHEFVVVQTDLPADGLPIAADGLSVNEEWLSKVGELPEAPAGQTDLLSLHLAPGRYVFFCNLEGHYLGGMHGVIEVTG